MDFLIDLASQQNQGERINKASSLIYRRTFIDSCVSGFNVYDCTTHKNKNQEGFQIGSLNISKQNGYIKVPSTGHSIGWRKGKTIQYKSFNNLTCLSCNIY